MGLSSYTYSWTLKSSRPFEDIEEFKTLNDILSLSDIDECYFHISKEMGFLLHSEKQFNEVFGSEYGKLNYLDFLKGDKITKLGTLQDAKPWYDSEELTVINSMEDDFEVFENNKLLFFLIELKKYLDGFKWHSEKPKLYSKIDEINLLIVVGRFCHRNDVIIKMISA